MITDKLCNHKYFFDNDKNANNKIYLLLETNLFFFESWSKYLNIFLQKSLKEDFGINEEIGKTYLSSTDDENNEKRPSHFILKFADGFKIDQTLGFKPSYKENIYTNLVKKNQNNVEEKMEMVTDENYGKLKKNMKKNQLKSHPYWKMVSYVGYLETYWNILNRISEKTLNNLNSMNFI